MIEITQHKSAKYPPRTYQTGKESDITIAIAVNYDTPGEKLTEKAAKNYLRIDFENWDEWYDSTKETYISNAFSKISSKNLVVNVAGNSIPTFLKHGITQLQVNKKVYDIIRFIHKHYPISKILSGGQTGSDTAGVVAAIALKIPTKIIFPNGFLQRNQANNDVTTTEADYLDLVLGYVDGLVK